MNKLIPGTVVHLFSRRIIILSELGPMYKYTNVFRCLVTEDSYGCIALYSECFFRDHIIDGRGIIICE